MKINNGKPVSKPQTLIVTTFYFLQERERERETERKRDKEKEKITINQ